MSREFAGLHINKLEAAHLRHIGGMRAGWHTMLDPAQGQVAEVKAADPGCKVLDRTYIRDQDYHQRVWQNPEQAGQWAAGVALAAAGKNPQADAHIIQNEPPADSIDWIRKIARADIAFMEAMHAQSRKGAIGAWSGGTLQLPSIDGGAAIRAYAPALAKAKELGVPLVVHAYSPLTLFTGGTAPSGWDYNPLYFLTRWREIVAWCRANGVAIGNFFYSEWGQDLGFAKPHGYTGEPVGWQAARPWGFSSDGGANYITQLRTSAAELAKDPNCEGGTIFCAGDNGDAKWRPFMVDHILPQLAAEAFPLVMKGEAPMPEPTPTPQPTLNIELAVPYVAQRGEGANGSANDCGAAATKSLILINRTTAPQVDLLAREAAGIEGEAYPNYDGLTMATLIELSRRYGVTVQRKKPLTWDTASWEVTEHLGNKRPIIALVHYDSLPLANRSEKRNGKVKGHYIVLVGVKDGKVIYHDPYHDGTGGKALRMTFAQLRAAWEANPLDDNPKYDMLVMTNPNWALPAPTVPEWTQRDAATVTWFSEQMARGLRGDEGALSALIGALQAEPKRQGLHDVIMQIAVPPLARERDKVSA